MQEFESISASSYDPSALATKLTAKAAEGWSVVAIVPDRRRRHGVRHPRQGRAAESTRPDRHEPAESEETGAEAAAPVLAVPPSRVAEPEERVERAGRLGHRSRAGQLRADSAAEPAAAAVAAAAVRTIPRRATSQRLRTSRRPPPRQPLPRRRGTRPCTSPGGSGRLVRRSGRPLRAALLGWQHLDRARVARRPAVHRSAGRLRSVTATRRDPVTEWPAG